MGERAALRLLWGTLPVRVVRPRVRATTDRRGFLGMPRASTATQRLISWADTANCRDLRECARVVLSTLTHHEEQVFGMRFGLGDTQQRSEEEIARHYTVPCEHILEIESHALRKLRYAGGRSLKSVNRT